MPSTSVTEVTGAAQSTATWRSRPVSSCSRRIQPSSSSARLSARTATAGSLTESSEKLLPRGPGPGSATKARSGWLSRAACQTVSASAQDAA